MPDYYNAALRHWTDAQHLLSDDRLANADQLFGLSAECALKAIMLSLGMPMDKGRPTNKKHGHVNVLWDEFVTFANGKGQAHYAAALGVSNPFANWEIAQRYENDSAINAEIVRAHQNSAQIAYNCLTQAVADGVV